ncbi:hypothetical protein [Pseudoxanthomonas kaohsiungensis]|uniref:Uncharacterized protein n=1 Tax=Pseudoxanthomonas kaohsiungensis TaxID=283923 RepID=A0ABW3LZ77_9GAMM|nr:hypothetical protein [Pseudoxanthomonas kaohsiungensis]KAF1702878.1 hypothetical protein CSC66_08885 [Pseudoxanthomonas kaohsiungensis]
MANDCYPQDLTPAQTAEAARLLASGRHVYVGQVFLSVDLDSGIIWQTDAYGCDSIASWTVDELGTRRALKRAQDSHQAPWHPAEGYQPS